MSKEHNISVDSELPVWVDLNVGDSITVHAPRSIKPGMDNRIQFTVVRESKQKIKIIPFIGTGVDVVDPDTIVKFRKMILGIDG